MHLAASGGHYELMQFLFSKGGSVEDEDKVMLKSKAFFLYLFILYNQQKIYRKTPQDDTTSR